MTSRGRVPTALLWLTIVTYSICSTSSGSWHIMVPLEVCSTYVPNGLFGTEESHLSYMLLHWECSIRQLIFAQRARTNVQA